MALGLMPDVLRVADASQLEPQDFLIRGMALDKSGFMVVGDSVRAGQQIRFMVSNSRGNMTAIGCKVLWVFTVVSGGLMCRQVVQLPALQTACCWLVVWKQCKLACLSDVTWHRCM